MFRSLKSVLSVTASFGLLLVVFAASVSGQTERCPYIENPAHREPLSKQMKERMIELCIQDTKKDFDEMVERTERVAKLTNEIKLSFAENNELSKDDREKLGEVEDLLSKIRKEMRADDEEDDKEKRPKSVVEAINLLQENTTKLVGEIKKTTRHTISAVAIQSSGTVMKLVKWLRFSN